MTFSQLLARSIIKKETMKPMRASYCFQTLLSLFSLESVVARQSSTIINSDVNGSKEEIAGEGVTLIIIKREAARIKAN